MQRGGCRHTRWPAYWNRLLGWIRTARKCKFPWPSGAQAKAEKTSSFLHCQHPPKVIFFWRQKEKWMQEMKAMLVLLAGCWAQTLLPDGLAEAGAGASHGSMTLGSRGGGHIATDDLTHPEVWNSVPFRPSVLNQIQLLSAGKTYTSEMSVGGEGKVTSFRRQHPGKMGDSVLRPSPWCWLGDKGYFGLFVWLHWVFFVLQRLSCPKGYGIFVPWLGMELASPALEGGFLTTGPPGKSPGDKGFKDSTREALQCAWSACTQSSHWLASK